MNWKIRGVWGSPSESGITQDSIRRYTDWLAELGVNALFMHLKGGDGLLYWPSEDFPQCIAPGHDQIDYPAMLLDACHERGIKLHAWMIDFFDGGFAAEKHPEWTARNALGQPTTCETLRGEPYSPVWQCPARRPGYTDQWLVPIYREFAARYPLDGIHHDYIRYPGDLAPDQYCFCDACLEAIPAFNGYLPHPYPEEPFFHDKYDRPYLEAHWEQSPRVLPANWSKLDRGSKSRFLLEGGFFAGGRPDLDYFFYSYRTYWVTEFARLAAQAVREVRPEMEISAAVFKNPIHSGRFIGQDWRQFKDYVDTPIPMNYRDHFPGTFDQYLGLLSEAIRMQLALPGFKDYACGVAINFLFKEESNSFPEAKVERVGETVANSGSTGLVFFCDSQIREFGMNAAVRRVFLGR